MAYVAARVVAGYAALVVLAVIVPAAYQRLVVQANELSYETPQIAHHIEATRNAWGIADVKLHELGPATELTPATIAANRATIDNVRLWDREPLLQTFGQLQSIRTYYDFVSVDDDRYRIGGQLRQVMLSARELDTDALPTKGFINEHLTYTHGMGVTLGPSNEVTTEGLPVLFIKDLPPVSSIPLPITRPQIYYGEQSNDFVLAPSGQREFDYPAGEGDAAVYSHLRRPWRRAGGVVRPAAALRLPLRVVQHPALARRHRPLAHPLQPQHRRPRAACAAIPRVRSRSVHGRRRRRPPEVARSTGTRRPTGTRTRSRWPTAPTTCGTRSRS